MGLKIRLARHFDQSRLRSFARENDRRDRRQPSFLHQIHLFSPCKRLLDLFLLRKHFIEEVIHVCFRSDNDSNAMVIELVNHLHKARQFVLLRHIELRNISNNHRVERGRNRFIVIRPAILFLTRIIHFHFLADLLVIHTTNAVLRCGKMNRPRWRQRQIERLRSRRTQLREHSVYFSNKHSSQTKHGVRRRTVWREDDIVHRMRERLSIIDGRGNVDNARVRRNEGNKRKEKHPIQPVHVKHLRRMIARRKDDASSLIKRFKDVRKNESIGDVRYVELIKTNQNVRHRDLLRNLHNRVLFAR